jgi:hypothetical protein
MHPVVRLITALFLLCFHPCNTDAESAAMTVVVLHSYHQGYEWTNEVNIGIRSVFQSHSGYEPAYEYLDAQRTASSSLDQLEALLEAWYAGRLPAVVVAVDDNALQFLIERRSLVFPGVPVAFSGINDIGIYPEAALAGMTGVTGSPDIVGSLEMALRVFPATKRIPVLADETTAGTLNMWRLDRNIQKLPAELEIVRTVAPEPDELTATLSGLEQGAVFL